MHVSATLLIHPSTLPHIQKSVLYICVTILALEIGSSVPFSKFHMHVLIYNICHSHSVTLHGSL